MEILGFLIVCFICWLIYDQRKLAGPQAKRQVIKLKTESSPERVENNRPEKDASFEFTVLGILCKVWYFSDWQYLLTITKPDEYHYDPRRWIDVDYKGQRHGYAWKEGYWTHTANGISETDQIEYMICKHFGTLFPDIAPGSIETTERKSEDKEYKLRGEIGKITIAAQFKHNGFVVSFQINEDKGRYDTRNGILTAPVRVKPTEKAIIAWITSEYNLLRPLKGGLPQASGN